MHIQLNHLKKYIILLVILLMTSSFSYAELKDFGAIANVGLQKDLNKNLVLNFEEEVRFKFNLSSFSRSKTMIGVDILLIPSYLTAEANYSLFYRKAQVETYEFSHRLTAGFSGKVSLFDLVFKYRTRFQSTMFDGENPTSKFNPKHVWRNRIGMEYPIQNSAFTPYLLGEIISPLNGSNKNFLIEYRLSAGTKYQLTKTSSLNGSLRYDQAVNTISPHNILYLTIGYNFQF